MNVSDIPGFPEEAKGPGFNPATPARMEAAGLTVDATFLTAQRLAGGNPQRAAMEAWKMLHGDGALLYALMVTACAMFVDRPKKGHRR